MKTGLKLNQQPQQRHLPSLPSTIIHQHHCMLACQHVRGQSPMCQAGFRWTLASWISLQIRAWRPSQPIGGVRACLPPLGKWEANATYCCSTSWSEGGAHVSTPRPGSRAAICCAGSPLAERRRTCSHPSDWLRGAPCPYLERNPTRQCPKKPRLAHWTPPTYVLTRTRAIVPVDDGGRKRRQVSLLSWI